jgi:O-acetyl-ADP-ribose deacetylase (regulator of RNase III)
MNDSLDIGECTIRLLKGDITDLDIESFVFYAREDLKLGSGFGTAISIRGGPSIQEELDRMATRKVTDVVISSAGRLKANHIIHAVGPKFQEENLEDKLHRTIHNCLKAADEKGIKSIAFPAMGCGFYGVPVEVSARVTLQAIEKYISHNTGIQEIIICVLDNREYQPFLAQFTGWQARKEES